MRRELGQPEGIAALVDWTAFQRMLGPVYAAPVGRPEWFKALAVG